MLGDLLINRYLSNKYNLLIRYAKDKSIYRSQFGWLLMSSNPNVRLYQTFDKRSSLPNNASNFKVTPSLGIEPEWI